MQGVHDLFYTGLPVPPMDVENVDVAGSQVLQARFNGVSEALRAVARVGGTAYRMSRKEMVAGILRSMLERLQT
jgi:hypothetical protein